MAAVAVVVVVAVAVAVAVPELVAVVEGGMMRRRVAEVGATAWLQSRFARRMVAAVAADCRG